MNLDFEAYAREAMAESTAQNIFTRLRELEGERPVYAKRWPWELLQNAVDVAKSGGVNCVFIFDENELTFIHDGAPFKLKEVAHLIYHGTTKTDDPNKVRFGTGFITTHLLSRNPHVKGILEDGRRFCFELNREGESWGQLEEKMNIIQKQFLDSLHSEVHLTPNATVEYKYVLSSEGQLQTAIAGIEAIRANIAFVIALNENLSSVTLVQRDVETRWTKLLDEVKVIDEKITIVPVQSISKDERRVHSVAIAREGSVATALLLVGEHPEYSIESLENAPKLFYGFPLTTTEYFPLPAITSSPLFVPKEKRDGLLLGSSDSDDNRHNKQLIVKSAELFEKLAECAVNLRCSKLHRLAKTYALPNVDNAILDSAWLKTLVAALINFLKNLDLVEQKSVAELESKLVTPIMAYLPYDEDPKTLQEIWNLAENIWPEKLPSQDVVADWAAILRMWSWYLNVDVRNMAETLTLDKFALTVSQLGSINNLKQKLVGEPVPATTTWLNKLLELIHHERQPLLSSLSLIPNQLGSFKRMTEIYRDEQIDETIKDASFSLGNEVRGKLCNREITKVIQDSLPPYTEEGLLNETVSSLKKKAAPETEYSKKQYQEANITLFCWLTEKGRFDILRDNFPVISYKRDKGEPKFISRLLQEQPLLKPVSLWDEDAKLHADAFPDHMILSDVYLTGRISGAAWENLVTQGLILGDLFVKKRETVDEKMMMKLLAEGELDDKEHVAKDEIELSRIVFLDQPEDWGVINMVRRSKKKATQFLKFLLGYVVQKDTSWLNPVPVECSCTGESGAAHRIYPSKWLYELKSKEWVPVGKNEEEPATTESLAPLFYKDQDLLLYLRGDRPSSFLSILGVSPSQIMLAAQPPKQKLQLDKAFVKLLLVTNSDYNELNKIAQVYQNPNLRSKLEEAYGLDEKVKRNQIVGKNVEEILRDSIRKHLPEEKFSVYRITKGADIGIDLEFDLLDETLQPQVLGMQIKDKSFAIEVKSTHMDYVRITLSQAREAIEGIESFILCVVELPPDFENLPKSEAEKLVREKARFVLRLGSRLKDKFNEAQEFEKRQERIKTSLAGSVTIDTTDVQIRLRLNR